MLKCCGQKSSIFVSFIPRSRTQTSRFQRTQYVCTGKHWLLATRYGCEVARRNGKTEESAEAFDHASSQNPSKHLDSGVSATWNYREGRHAWSI